MDFGKTKSDTGCLKVLENAAELDLSKKHGSKYYKCYVCDFLVWCKHLDRFVFSKGRLGIWYTYTRENWISGLLVLGRTGYLIYLW